MKTWKERQHYGRLKFPGGYTLCWHYIDNPWTFFTMSWAKR